MNESDYIIAEVRIDDLIIGPNKLNSEEYSALLKKILKEGQRDAIPVRQKGELYRVIPAERFTAMVHALNDLNYDSVRVHIYP